MQTMMRQPMSNDGRYNGISSSKSSLLQPETHHRLSTNVSYPSTSSSIGVNLVLQKHKKSNAILDGEKPRRRHRIETPSFPFATNFASSRLPFLLCGKKKKETDASGRVTQQIRVATCASVGDLMAIAGILFHLPVATLAGQTGKILTERNDQVPLVRYFGEGDTIFINPSHAVTFDASFPSQRREENSGSHVRSHEKRASSSNSSSSFSSEAAYKELNFLQEKMQQTRSLSRPTSSIVAQGSVSQYNLPGGSSACTSICLLAASKILQNVHRCYDNLKAIQGFHLDHFVHLGVDAYEEYTSSASASSSVSDPACSREVQHSSLDELWESSAYSKRVKKLERGEPFWGLVHGTGFQRGLEHVQAFVGSRSGSAKTVAAILTKSPETILILTSDPSHGDESTWFLFDSHGKSDAKSKVVFFEEYSSTSLLAQGLKTRYPPLFEREQDGGVGGLQMDMYNLFEMHPILLKVDHVHPGEGVRLEQHAGATVHSIGTIVHPYANNRSVHDARFHHDDAKVSLHGKTTSAEGTGNGTHCVIPSAPPLHSQSLSTQDDNTPQKSNATTSIMDLDIVSKQLKQKQGELNQKVCGAEQDNLKDNVTHRQKARLSSKSKDAWAHEYSAATRTTSFLAIPRKGTVPIPVDCPPANVACSADGARTSNSNPLKAETHRKEQDNYDFKISSFLLSVSNDGGENVRHPLGTSKRPYRQSNNAMLTETQNSLQLQTEDIDNEEARLRSQWLLLEKERRYLMSQFVPVHGQEARSESFRRVTKELEEVQMKLAQMCSRKLSSLPKE